MLQEQGLEVGQGVLLAKDSPYVFLAVWCTAIELMLLHFCKLGNQLLVNNKILNAVPAWRLVLMRSHPRFQEFRHPEVWIAQ